MKDAARVDVLVQPVEPREVPSHGWQVAEREAIVEPEPVAERRHAPAVTLERLGRYAEREVGTAANDHVGLDAARLEHLPSTRCTPWQPRPI